MGVSASAFNTENTPFSVQVPCGTLNVSGFVAFANNEPLLDITATEDSISFPGFSDEYVFLSVIALDISGAPFSNSWELHFGSIVMPVSVLDGNGLPVQGAVVQANATAYPDVGQSSITDASGMAIFANVPLTTIALVATTGDNSIGVNGVAATTDTTTLALLPFTLPGNGTIASDFDTGTLGWTAGTIEPNSTFQKRDAQDLVISTDGQYDVQTTSKEFQLYPFTESVCIRYKFITEEVPSGYFGTQFNDYYSVTIRDDVGTYVSITNSMNALGIGAFDASGATQWFTLQLNVASTAAITHFDVAVSNVVDNLYDSEVVIDHVGDLTCDSCGDCSVCAGDPMCQDSCQNPPLQSCAFYQDCADATMQCPGGGYAINYGDKNCRAFSNNLGLLSSAGVTWVWDVMHCLQLALIPNLPPADCDATCNSVYNAAFASHPACYVDNGFCSLPVSDWAAILYIVGQDVFASFVQVGITGTACAKSILSNVADAVETAVEDAATAALNFAADAALEAAEALALEVLQKTFQYYLEPSI